MKKIITTIVSVILLLLISKGDSYAFEQASGSSAKLNSTIIETPYDNRVEILEGFLNQYNSPLAPYAADFVRSADQYSLDWRLVAAISGVESTFGKNVPSYSHNGWGWGVYGNNVLRFTSWSEAIEAISKGLREGYLKENEESNPYVIGPTYAASPTWAGRVTYFMEKIDQYRIRNAKSTLALAL